MIVERKKDRLISILMRFIIFVAKDVEISMSLRCEEFSKCNILYTRFICACVVKSLSNIQQ